MSDEQKYYSLQRLSNTYKTLEKLKPPPDQEFVVYAYFLYSEPTDGIHGKQIYLGAYPTKRKALEITENIIKRTGHDCIYITESCNWENIDENHRPDRTLYMDPQTKAKDLEEQYRYKILKDSEVEEERELISQELEEQAELELDKSTVEHYAHNWFNLIKNKASYEYHKQQMEYYETMCRQREDKIKSQYNNDSSVDSQWLEIYEPRLKRRGEEDIFIMLKEGYNLLSKDLLKN